MSAEQALANLRHLYENLRNGGVRDTASAKRIATGLLGPAIEALERTPSAPGAPQEAAAPQSPELTTGPLGDTTGAAAVPAVGQEPPFGSKRAAALALYRPPFRFTHGYIYDAANQMVADQDGFEGAVETHVAARVRGWGRIGYLPDAAALQDEVGQAIADALTAYWGAALAGGDGAEREWLKCDACGKDMRGHDRMGHCATGGEG